MIHDDSTAREEQMPIGAAVEYLHKLRREAINAEAGNVKGLTRHLQMNIGKSRDLLETTEATDAALAHLLGAGNALIWELAPISKQTAELRKDKIVDLRHAFETALNIAVEEVRKAKAKG
jgi:hypothetical protein